MNDIKNPIQAVKEWRKIKKEKKACAEHLEQDLETQRIVENQEKTEENEDPRYLKFIDHLLSEIDRISKELQTVYAGLYQIRKENEKLKEEMQESINNE